MAEAAKKKGSGSGSGSGVGENVSYRMLQGLLQARGVLAARLGLMFQGARDLYTSFGYQPYGAVTYELMRQRYERQDIVSRIVNAYPDAVWTRPPQIIGNRALGDQIEALDQQLALFHYINRADRLAGLGKYSILFLGFDDVKDNSGLSKPVRQGAKLAYLQSFGYADAPIGQFDTNLSSPHYGLPMIYDLRTKDAASITGATNGQTIQVHYSRTIHIADCLLDNEINGYPILERVYNRLDDIEKTVGGSAEMFWHSGRQGLQVDVDKDTEFTEDDAKNLKAELEDFAQNIQRYIRTRGVNIKDLGGKTINPEPVFNVIMSIISVATGIPQRIFIGSEQGKLASEQDRANWAIRVDERRKLYAEPRILHPIIRRLQAVGVLTGGAYTLEWPEAFRMSPLERGQTSAQQARAAANVVNAMVKFATPIEGVDYPIQQITGSSKTVKSGGSGGDQKALPPPADAAKGKAAAMAGALPANNNSPGGSGSVGGSGGSGSSGKPGGASETTTETTMQEVKVPRREIISIDEARAIIFAQGELKTEGKIDGVMD